MEPAIEELKAKIPGQRWQKLCEHSNGKIAVHSIKVLFRTVRDPIFESEMNDEEKNILKWAALLHDISKRGQPEIQGKDHIHPFVSAATTLEILREFGFIRLENELQEEEFQKVIDLIHESKVKIYSDNDKVCQHIHSHTHLHRIFHSFWSPESPLFEAMMRGGFNDLVFRLVLFHQSLKGVQKFVPRKILTEPERFMFCDPKLYKLMCVLMIADSSSYNFFHSKKTDLKNRQEFI